jgi:hypothetical protein
MPARRLRRLRRFVVLALLGLLVAKVVDVLRGDPAPAFSRHPSVDGGPRPVPTVPSPTSTDPTDGSEPTDPPSEPTVPADAPAAPHLGPAPSAPVTDAGSTGPYPLTDPAHAWVDPVDGACPPGFPVKVKLRSGIYHLPGMAAYERTVPDRCYPTAETAAADGLRAARR